jgi:TRAP-type mannitol/chloroaromatic compound transport system permease small subunit
MNFLVILSQKIHRFSQTTGNLVAWLTLFMVILSVINVMASWLFNTSWIWMRESVTWMHGANFLLAAAYTLNRQAHVRVDIFYAKMSQQKQAIVDFVGTLLLMLPTSIFIAWASWPAFSLSWRVGEVSSEAGGLPALWILKGLLLIMPLLLIIESINQLVKSTRKFSAQTPENLLDDNSQQGVL